MNTKIFNEYVKKIEKAVSKGNATEHTYRPALKSLVEEIGGKGLIATNEPKRIDCGAPDFIVTRGEVPIGYIEAKDVDKPLGRVEKGEQMRRYLDGLGNLILTDYLEFRWYIGGERKITARLARINLKGEFVRKKDGPQKVACLLQSFFDASPPAINNAKELADRMARMARLLRDIITRTLRVEKEKGSLHQQMEGFRKVLIHDLTEPQFADMYAQTICYGLFAARCNHKDRERFTRKNAPYDLPRTNPFLKKMFGHIAGLDLDSSIVWAVDDLAELLHRVDINAILRDFGRHTHRKDPVIHFYEDFLAAYDPKMREARGVYYTPEPVVSYIVRSVDHILKTDFGLADGLADYSTVKIKNRETGEEKEVHKVQILDPAAGTGTFLHGVIDAIHETFKENKGMWSGYVSRHLLPRVYGFELLVAPYAVAHMKLGLQLKETGYDLNTGERLRLYLTNTLEEAFNIQKSFPFAQWLTDEANAAREVKKEAPVMVVLGNPPYSGHSANVGEWITKLLKGFDTLSNSKTENYFEVDGRPLREKNSKWLNDDYVKFIRFSQWRIEKTGYGVLAFISNHGYLDNPTFRGMRRSLMNTFDDIYLLDLHGNAKKKERCPDGTKDENVFDIQQGVAIGIFVKRPGKRKKDAVVRHADLWGLREVYKKGKKDDQELSGGKYHRLLQNEISTTKWKKLKPQTPFYLFVPQDTRLLKEYEKGWKVTDIFPIHGVGMTTARDHVVTDFSKNPLLERAKLFRDSKDSDEELCRNLSMPMKKGWNISNARKLIQNETKLEDHIKSVTYRPFDNRFIFYHDSLVWRTVRKVMVHMMKRNLALLTCRQQNTIGFYHAFVSNEIAESCIVSNQTREISYLFPLYIYQQVKKIQKKSFETAMMLFEPQADYEIKRPNIAPFLLEKLKASYKKEPSPEQIFYYIYAILYSPIYRRRYAEFLKMDFPRLPLTSNKALFRKLGALGERLVGLHLMEKQARPIAKYPVEGDNVVEKVRYTEPGQGSKKGRVWINDTQYFEGVKPQVWEFRIGGYQALQKWLKDRKDRKLGFDDQAHYARIVSAISETIGIMAAIDETVNAHGGWPIQ